MSTWIAGLDALAAGWAPAVWRASWQGAIAVALVWVVCRVVPRMSAPVRCWLWRLVCLKLLISLLWANPVAELPVLPALPREPVETEMNGPLAAQAEEEVNETPPAPAEAEVNAMHAVPVAVSLPASVSSVSSLPAPASPAPLALPSAPSLLLLAWVLGVAWCVLRTGREWALVRCLCRASRAVDAPLILNISRELCDRLRVRRPPDLIRSEAIESPILIGTLRPMILLPDRLLSEASGGQLRLMLTHELIHLKQRDLWWGWLSLSAHTLFFFHPLVWLASREWHLAQEVACDERAVKATGAAPGAYGEMLLCVASARYSGPCCAPATVGVMESCRTLTSRLVAIKHIVSISRKSLAASASLVLLFATAGIVPWRLVHSTATAQEAALEPAVLGSVVQDMVDQLASEDADARLLGAYGLWTLADERGANVELSPTTPALVEALEDEDREVRWNAALALVSVGRHSAEPAETLPPAIPALVEAVQDGELQMRFEAARALGTIGWSVRSGGALTPAVGPLIAMLNHEGPETLGAFPPVYGVWPGPDRKAYGAAAWALGMAVANVPDGAVFRPAIPRLIEILDDEEQNIVGYATFALESIVSRQGNVAIFKPAIPRLTELIGHEREKIGGHAARALASIGARGGLDEAAFEPLMPQLIEKLGDEDADAVHNAVFLLAGIAGAAPDASMFEPAIPRLIELLGHERLETAAYAAAAIGEIAAPPSQRGALNRGDKYEAAADDLGLKPAVPRVVELLGRGTGNVAVRAAGALSSIMARGVFDEETLKSAVPRLVEMLGMPATARSAGYAIASIAATEVLDGEALKPAIPRLIAIFEDENLHRANCAGDALRAIAGYGEDEGMSTYIVEALIEAILDGGKGAIRAWSALESAGQRVNPETVLKPFISELIDKSGDEDKEVRWRAALALVAVAKRLRNIPTDNAIDLVPSAFPPLVEALRDGDLQMRWEAARALGKIASYGPYVGDGTELIPAVAPLTAMLNDEGPETLGTFPRLGTGTTQWVKGTDRKACGVAAWALGRVALRVTDPTEFKPAVPRLVELIGDEEASIADYARRPLSRVAPLIEDEAMLEQIVEAALERGIPFAAYLLRGMARGLRDVSVLRPVLPILVNALDDEDPDMREFAIIPLLALATRIPDEAAQKAAVSAAVELLAEDPSRWKLVNPLAAIIPSHTQDKAVLRTLTQTFVASIGRMYEEMPDGTMGPPGMAWYTALCASWELPAITPLVEDDEVLTAAIPPLLRATKHSYGRLRCATAWTLGAVAIEVRDRQALDTAVAILVKAVDGEDPGSACFGLATLAENGTDLAVLEPAIEPVIAMFSQDHPSQRTRFHAARFLSLVAVETQDRQMLTAAVTTLLRMIGSAAANNRGAVCVILTRLAERGAESAALKPTIPLLAKRLADPEKSVRDGAEAALAAIGTPEAKAALRAHGG